MALPGISNANEFYSAHYLDSVLTNDIKKVRERWAEEARAQVEADPSADVATPEAQFKALRKPWQKLREAELGISGDPAERLRLQRELFFRPLLEALGYPYAPKPEPVLIGGEAYQVPLLAEVSNAKGEPWLWVVECFNPSDEPTDPLELTIATNWACQIHDPSLGKVLEGETWETLISERIFGQEIPPRWVLAVSRDQLLLIDRQKWAASRLLRFELDTLLGDINADALLAAATLLHREHTCPSGGGTPYLDELDENSHKHAYEVSGDLKYALRKSIELLGNEAIHWRRSKGEGVFKGKTDADQLTLECLRYMYRLLFLFYIESRPDLGYAPMGSDVYRLGYSLESLREMDTAELGSEEDKEGTYISDSLDRLFQMIWEGYPKREDATAQLPIADAGDPFHDSFRLTPLKAHLFDPERMPALTRVRFRNVVLQEVIELMSLTKEGKGKRRGRVSYSQLGINQLGAVYEALLSFRGFFAEEDLFEVQPAPKKAKASASDEDDEPEDSNEEEGDDTENATASGQEHNELEVGHFVTAEQLKAYKAEEIVAEKDTGKPRCHPKGSFIYRLAGRDREKSASYYTPESLTQCLVKYALKELLPGKTAAEILQLKVCEPAMGSAAFLNEVVNQLAQAYLELRQQETGRSIPHEQFATELQKVKMRLADQNVFGIDLNPVAVELAEVSLWLNSIFTPENGRAFVPWFSQQLVCGNSLIGARRQIYRVNQLPTGSGRKAKPSKGQGPKLWHEHAPEELAWDAELPEGAIFHFLLPDPGMAAYKDKVIKELEPEAIERCQRWNKAFVGEAFSESQISHLLRLSKLVDDLWKAWAEQQKQLRLRTTDPLPVWPESETTGANDIAWTSLKLKDRIQEQEVNGRDVANTNARLRLKWAMDYWSALWFWPINQAGSLPSRDTWLLELSMILGDLEQGVAPELGQGQLFADTQPQQLAVDFSDRHGFVDVEKLKAEFERLRQVEAIAKRIRPLHWDLEFADILKNDGFHLIIGNPPWIRPEWKDRDFIGDSEPLVSIRKDYTSILKESLLILRRNPDQSLSYISAKCETQSTLAFLGKAEEKNMLTGQQHNLYKHFILLGWRLSRASGTLALLHDVGLYENRRGERMRKVAYSKLRLHLRFINQLGLFADLRNEYNYEMSIFGPDRTRPSFMSCSYLFHPNTIYESLDEGASADGEGIKNNQQEWNTKGYKLRVIHIGEDKLSLFSDLSARNSGDADKSPAPQFFALFSENLIPALSKVAKSSRPLRDVCRIYTTENFKESEAKKAGLIEKSTQFPDQQILPIVNGPMVGHGNCFYQTPNRVCNTNRAYSVVPRGLLADGYLPRTNFYAESQGSCRLDPSVELGDCTMRYTERYKLVVRRRLGTYQNRTLIPSILPPRWGHVDAVSGAVFDSHEDLCFATGIMLSTVLDFYVKASAIQDLYPLDLAGLPFPDVDLYASQAFRDNLIFRALRICCTSPQHADLWNHFEGKPMHQLESVYGVFDDINGMSSTWPKWSRELALQSDLQRKQCLAEIDVIVAKSFGINCDELRSAYDVQFPVAKQYETSTYYSSCGAVAASSDKALSLLTSTLSEIREGLPIQHECLSEEILDAPIRIANIFSPPFSRFFVTSSYVRLYEESDWLENLHFGPRGESFPLGLQR